MDNFNRKFSVPYNSGIEGYFESLGEYLYDYYFTDNSYRSARPNIDSTPTEKYLEINRYAKSLGIKSNFILNSAFYENSIYSPSELTSLARHINGLEVDILTINNAMILQSDYFIKELNPEIILKNSVNNTVDSVNKAAFWFTRFGIKDIIIDRSLNRNQEELKKVLEYCRANNITSTVLLNEGCIPDCLYKQFCDLKVSTGAYDIDSGKADKSTSGCGVDFNTDPALVLKSPFITRKNLLKIIDDVDVFKISGRLSGIDFLHNVLRYYILNDRSLSVGKLLSTHPPEVYGNISIYALEEYGYSDKVHDCKSQCNVDCNYCDKIFKSVINKI